MKIGEIWVSKVLRVEITDIEFGKVFKGMESGDKEWMAQKIKEKGYDGEDYIITVKVILPEAMKNMKSIFPRSRFLELFKPFIGEENGQV